MILSRQVPLADLAKDFKSIGTHLCGQQSGNNGEAAMSVSVKQETVAGQGVFVVKLLTLGRWSDVGTNTINATEHLKVLRLERDQEEDDAIRRKLLLMLQERSKFLEKAQREVEEASSTVLEARALLDDAIARVQIAKEQVGKTEMAMENAQSRRDDAQNARLELEKKLQELQLRDDARKKALKDARSRREYARNEPEENPPELPLRVPEAFQLRPSYMAGQSRARLVVGIDFVSAN
jgi:hypothetical protein